MAKTSHAPSILFLCNMWRKDHCKMWRKDHCNMYRKTAATYRATIFSLYLIHHKKLWRSRILPKNTTLENVLIISINVVSNRRLCVCANLPRALIHFDRRRLLSKMRCWAYSCRLFYSFSEFTLLQSDKNFVKPSFHLIKTILPIEKTSVSLSQSNKLETPTVLRLSM